MTGGQPGVDPNGEQMIKAPAARALASLSRRARSAGTGAAAWAESQWREVAAHPARAVWTLLVSLAYLVAIRPLLHYDQAFWWHARSWFLANYQQDYGEGPLLNQEILLYHGLNIYSPDTAPPFTVGNYPPVFPFVVSLFMRHYGLTLTAGRLVSSLSIMGSAVVAGLIVLQATRQVLPALIAGGLLPTFSGIFYWGPLNRVDSLALFLSLLTVLVVVRYAGTRRVWWAVPLAVLTVYTRQSMIDGILAAYVYLLFRDWRRAIAVGLATAGAGLAVFLGLQVWSHGNFYLNIVVDNENAWNFGTVLGNWRNWMQTAGGRFVFRLGLAGAAAGLFGGGGILWPVWLAAAAGLFVTIGKTGAAINYFFPIYAASAVCLGVFAARLRTAFRRAPFPLWPLELLLPAMLFAYIHGSAPSWAARLPLARRALSVVAGYNLTKAAVAHTGPKGDLAPTNAADQQMIAYLRAVQGPVLSLDFPAAVQVQAGHQLQWQPFELGAVHADGLWNGQAFLRAIEDRYYSLVFFHNLTGVQNYVHGALGQEIVLAVEADYAPAGSVAGYQVWRPGSGAPRTVSGPQPAATPAPLPPGVRLGAGEPAPQSAGPFTEVSIFHWLNDQGVIDPGRPAAAGQSFDNGGSSFSAAIFPKAGTLTVPAGGSAVPFLVPQTGTGIVSSLDLTLGATLALPAQRDSALWLLEAGVNGNRAVTVQLRYRDGTTSSVQAAFTDWCNPPVPSEYPAYNAPYRLNGAGNRVTPACGVFALRIPVDAAHALTSAAFEPDGNAQIFAVTVQKA